MNTRIIVSAIGLLGMILTLVQIHSLQSIATHLYDLTGIQTEAQELYTVADAAPTSSSADAAREQVVIYKQRSYASAAEKAAREIRVWATAYTSHPMETDDTPFITASGSTVRDGVAAANFLPMGTKFRLPKLYGEKVFVVEDRMNARYNDTKIIDLWFESRTDALHFGKKSVMIELL